MPLPFWRVCRYNKSLKYDAIKSFKIQIWKWYQLPITVSASYQLNKSYILLKIKWDSSCYNSIKSVTTIGNRCRCFSHELESIYRKTNSAWPLRLGSLKNKPKLDWILTASTEWLCQYKDNHKARKNRQKYQSHSL